MEHLSGEETLGKPVSTEHNFPHFEILEEGFSGIRMESKSESSSDDSKNDRHRFDWDVVDATKSKMSTKVRQDQVNIVYTILQHNLLIKIGFNRKKIEFNN